MADTDRFYVTLRDVEGKNNPFTVLYKVNDHALAQFWKSCIIKQFLEPGNLSYDHPIEKTFMLHGWQTSWEDTEYTRNISVLCNMLNESIAYINDDRGLKDYGKIDLHYTAEMLKDHNNFQDMMNQIHHHFEKLIGQVWDPSPWFHRCFTKQAQYGIHQLNNLCHEIEGNIHSIQGKSYTGGAFLSFNGPRLDYEPKFEITRWDLKPEHYECFEERNPEWGDVTAYYSQLGKRHIEAFIDKDEHIDKKNISGIRYMTGECILSFRKDPPGRNCPAISPEFRDWLIENGWDPEDKTLALGAGYLAHADLEKMGMDWDEADNLVKKCDDIYEIGFMDEDGNKKFYRTFDFTWKDQHRKAVESL